MPQWALQSVQNETVPPSTLDFQSLRHSISFKNAISLLHVLDQAVMTTIAIWIESMLRSVFVCVHVWSKSTTSPAILKFIRCIEKLMPLFWI